MAINPAGAIAGEFGFPSHGFLRSPDGVITTFDPPGSIETFSLGIGPSGAIIGAFFDAHFVGHGFLRLP
jgi:hypothetical protein